ncbi:RNA polymerase sigma factor [Oscillibacter sp.]|uniref:RNA polymerase sigma factor n=1 Tax=Oscillibacter sp. TaxID=1945593 RepID=UPI002D804E03|nr:RNA polymerase sigma factor [Oscillibacter sp.]
MTTEQITYTRREAEALVERWADTVLRVAYTWTGNPQDAQDVCQTVLLKLLTHPEHFPDPERQRAWVLRVTVNCCKDLKKSAWARKRVSLEAAADAAVTMPELGESPVLEAVLALPEKYRQTVYLRYYEEYGIDEIAALMGCKASQVSTWLYRGKAKLRTMLGGSYGQECISD